MKKRFILSVALLMAGIAAFAQKPVVLIDYFNAPKSVKASAVSAVRGAVIAGINQMNRVQLIDVESESSLNMEGVRRVKESAMFDQNARMGAIKTLGAQYIITGTVSNVSGERHNSDGRTYYTGNIVYSLSVVRVEDGVTVGTKNVTYSGLTGNVGSTADEAVVSTLNRVKQSMDNFVNEYFKIKGTIVEMKDTNKKGDKVSSLYINLGSEAGMDKGQKLNVYKVSIISGVEGEELIGALTVDEVVAPTLSKCKVTKGGKAIMAAYKNGDGLRVETKKDGWLTDLGKGVADTFK